MIFFCWICILFVFVFSNISLNYQTFIHKYQCKPKYICICIGHKWYLDKFVFAKKIKQKIIFFICQKKLTLLDLYLYLGLNIAFLTQWNSKDYRITNLHKMVTSYGNVKNEIKLKLDLIVVGLHMYLVNIYANQSDKKSHF